MGSSQIGNGLGIYRHLTKAALTTRLTQNGLYYEVTTPPDDKLRNPATGSPLAVNVNSLAFSANGEWMVTNVPHTGLLRVHMTDFSTQLFSQPLEPSSFLGLTSQSLAISNDGRYVAANINIFGTGNLAVYDLSTCTDQLLSPALSRQYCAGKDIWNGGRTDVYAPGSGILSQQPDMQQPTYIRFVNDDTISFSARYAVTSSSRFKAATFVVTAPGSTERKIGLLGFGDSYISGQGAFDYRKGTDSLTNKCHLSELSYPFILGVKYFDSSGSIACSGATTNELVGTSTLFKGQVTDTLTEKDRDKSNILANFLPGYIYQQEFASTYLPEAMLVSVGGDNVGFADIVKSCVANVGGGTCYANYEDRAELVNEINAAYPDLVSTYTTLREQSAYGRLYVVGYPQIAKVGGNCGLNVHLNSDEVAFSAELIDYLDSVVQKAAATAGVFYVDTQQAFDGHRLCETGDKAMNGVTAGNDAGVNIHGHPLNFIGSETYHPTPLGYRLLAQTIGAETDDLAAPMPMATPYVVPAFDPTAAILQGVPHSGRPIKVAMNDATMADDFMLSGSTQQVTVSNSQAQLQPGSKYQVVLHSDPMLLAEGGADAAGDIATTIHLPADVGPGYHTLHVYATDMAGDSIDLQKVVYVAASADDFDGDGIANSANACLIVPPSGVDMDQDGTDDACDPEITAVPAEVPPASSTPTSPSSSQTVPYPTNLQLALATAPVPAGITFGSAPTVPEVLGDSAMTVAEPTKQTNLSVAEATKSTAPRQLPVAVLAIAGLVITGFLSWKMRRK